jgi:tRNA(fMet)-specific endonuclease VapC
VSHGLILDSGILVAAERKKLDLHSLIGDRDPAIAAITALELLVGVERSVGERRDVRALHVEALLAVLPVESYTTEVARMHASLSKHTSRSGRPRGSFDLIIAATAATTGRTLVTTDAKADFAELPGVRVEIVNSAG